MAVDMMESKGSIYSNRDLTPMLRLSGWGDTMNLSQPGAFLRQQRGYIHRLFGTQAALRGHHGIIEGESQRFLQQVFSSPGDLANRVRHFTGSIVLKISYSYITKDENDPLISSANQLVRELSLAINLDSWPWMVDLFPSL